MQTFFPCDLFGTFLPAGHGPIAWPRLVVWMRSLWARRYLSCSNLSDDPALASRSTKIFRSLSQPGRFLVAPKSYCITRYAASDPDRAYRPVICLYSSLDAEDQSNNRCVLMTSLQPLLPPWVRKDIELKAAGLHHAPVLQYLTEIEADVAYNWAVQGGLTSFQAQAARLWDCFSGISRPIWRAAFSSGHAGQRGNLGQCSLHFAPIKLKLSTKLDLDLSELTGPWGDGPVESRCPVRKKQF